MKSKSKNKPIYSKEIEGAANTATNAYNAAAPGLAAGANDFAKLREGLLARYNSPDNPLNAARGHYSDVLSGKYLSGNPELDAVVGRVGNDISNQVSASLGTRGLTGGSSHSGIVGREVGRAASDLRYGDWANQLARMDNAASSVGSLGDAEAAMLAPAFQAYQAQVAPLLAANDHAGTIGGLLGQYQKTTQKGSVGGLLAGIAGSGLSAWAGGGFK